MGPEPAEPGEPPVTGESAGPDDHGQAMLPGPGRPEPVGRKVVERFMASFSAGIHSAPDQFIEKLDASQLGQLLDQAGEDNRRADARNVLSMKLGFAAFVVTVLLIPALCWIFLSFHEGQLMRDILILLIGLAGGGTAGYGIGRNRVPKDE